MDRQIVYAVGHIVLRATAEESSSDSGDELLLFSREKHARIDNFVQETVASYNLSDFKSHFRMSKAAVEDLCSKIETRPPITGRSTIPLLDRVLMTLWTIANQESFRGIGDRFNFARGHAHELFMKTCQELCVLEDEYITFPRGVKFRETVREFDELRGLRSFKNVVGVVDAMHIGIRGPADDNSFYDRKGNHSMILQSICNAHMEFIDVFAGWPGSSHDARVWQNSPIAARIVNENLIPDEYHLLGDTAYPLRSYLIVPFRDNGHLTPDQRRFNKRLSSTRVVIEQD